jgi:transposase
MKTLVHYWVREPQKLGRTVKLMMLQFVNTYVKTNKNDANDASAICEAASRPNGHDHFIAL